MISVGQRLQEERVKKGLSIEDVAEATKIRKNFLEHIEKGEYEKLPSATFAQGFVRNYASFLGMPEKETMALFKREFDEEKIFRVLPQGLAEDKSFPISRMNFSQVIIIAGLFFLLLIFLLFQYKDAIISPSVDVTNPKDNSVIHSTQIEVSGKTNPENVVYVNSFPVSVNDDGAFKKVISVFQGKNDIDIKVVNRFNKSTDKTVEVTVSM